MTANELIREYQSLPLAQRLQVAKVIDEDMADRLFEELDQLLPDVGMSEEEIMKEVKAVRNARTKNVAGRH